MVKLELAASMAAVCPGSSTVLATIMIVVEYRLVYQLIGRLQAAKACLGGSTVPASSGDSRSSVWSCRPESDLLTASYYYSAAYSRMAYYLSLLPVPPPPLYL